MRLQPLPVLAAVVTLALGSAAQANIIYYDSFSGSANDLLHGEAPDTRPGTETWTSREPTGTEPTPWTADGTIDISNSYHANSFLPFTPQAGQRYSLSMDANPDVSERELEDEWFGLAFTNDNVVDDSLHNVGSAFPYGWMLLRVNRGTDEMRSYLGPNDTDLADHDAPTGWVNMEIILDTTASQWTAEWFVNGTSVRGPQAFTSQPAINHVGFARFGTAGGAVDNFTLQLVPEPTSLALVGFGGLILMRRPRRRRPHAA